jgi:hypothetical protein
MGGSLIVAYLLVAGVTVEILWTYRKWTRAADTKSIGNTDSTDSKEER